MPPTEFERATEPLRRELLAHCFRLLGSHDEAEDQVQETYLRAWRSFEGFEGRSSLRTWLYRIATNACLTALESRARLPRPAGVPTDDGAWETGSSASEPAGDPAAVLESREHRREALGVAWEQLGPRPRAVLMLRDVLGWRATEVAELLGGTDDAVHTALRRARAQLADTPAATVAAAPSELLDRYATAFENGDVGTLVQLVTDDARFESGRLRLEGHAAIRQAISHCPVVGECKLVPITVRRRAGFAVYRTGADGVHRAYAIELVAATRAGAEHIEVIENRDAFATLGLPAVQLAAA